MYVGAWSHDNHMTSVQTKDLAAVHMGTKFSCQFSLKEIEARWQALLYDKHISR